MDREGTILELMVLLHLCRRWSERQGHRRLRRRKTSVIRRLLLYRNYTMPQERVWLEVIILAVRDLYEEAPKGDPDDSSEHLRACSDPLYFFDGRMRKHAQMAGCFSGAHVLQLMRKAQLFPPSVWDRISF